MHKSHVYESRTIFFLFSSPLEFNRSFSKSQKKTLCLG
uniref:Uncharacterized protein n=1 Tax=Arundo donax TaxID=35708 RepID=A0A0A9BN62_ARUDO